MECQIEELYARNVVSGIMENELNIKSEKSENILEISKTNTVQNNKNDTAIIENIRERRTRKQKCYDSEYIVFDTTNKQKLFTNQHLISINDDVSQQDSSNCSTSLAINSTYEVKFNVGDLVWAKVSGHPWWPCRISENMAENSCIKIVGSIRPKTMYYVEFFGPSTEHAWVVESCLIEYNGIESFKTFAQFQVDQAPTKSQKERLAEKFQLKVALTRRDHWEQAVNEADDNMKKQKANSNSSQIYFVDPENKKNNNFQTENLENHTLVNTSRKTSNFNFKKEITSRSLELEGINTSETEIKSRTSFKGVHNKLVQNNQNFPELKNANEIKHNEISLMKKKYQNNLTNKGNEKVTDLSNEMQSNANECVLSDRSLLYSGKYTTGTLSEQARIALLSLIVAVAKNEIKNSKLFKTTRDDHEKSAIIIKEKSNINNDRYEKPEDKSDSRLLRRQASHEKKLSVTQNSTLKSVQTNKKNISKPSQARQDKMIEESSSEEDAKISQTRKRANKEKDTNFKENETDSYNSNEISSAKKREVSFNSKENDNHDDDDDFEEDDGNDDDDEVLNDIDVEYEKLQLGFNVKKENICAVCEMPGPLIDCEGSCMQSFHLDCAGLINEPKDPETHFKCEECASGNHSCFQCRKPSSINNQTKKCSLSMCGKYYHDECARSSNLFRKEANKSSFICPLHACATCCISCEHLEALGNNVANLQAFKGPFLKCVRCPKSFHSGDFCLVAGSISLAGGNIICSDHFQPIRSQSQHNRVNVTWCFVCCKSGDLLGCDNCPAAYHYKCLGNPPNLSNNWSCEDCEKGKRPLFGEIVWVKVGVYRWWPAQICLPRDLPKNIREKSHQVGEFPVRFFGTNDYFWVARGRCFSFAEGDECSKYRNNQKGLALAFEKGVQYAKVTFRYIRKLKREKLHVNKIENKEASKTTKYNFKFIKTSKPIGNVFIPKIPLQDLPRCDCDPNSENPCGTDDCWNRILKYECHPSVCPAGERCQNQRFNKRRYPRQEPKYTGSCGWGLQNLVEIKKGEFVNEYVGELIDIEECRRRLEDAHDNDIKNFYFLALDKDRIVDAGPKGNLSRFMNHSCEPNLETQKWSVNGDIRVGLFALSDIPAYTELTFNYNLDCLGNEKAVCNCGAKNCSGFLGLRPKSSSSNSNFSTNIKNRDMIRPPRKKRKLNNINRSELRFLKNDNSLQQINFEDDFSKDELELALSN